MKTKAVTGIVLTMLFLVAASQIGVSVGVVDSESESRDFPLMMRGLPYLFSPLVFFDLPLLGSNAG